jgi:hypothetical protein
MCSVVVVGVAVVLFGGFFVQIFCFVFVQIKKHRYIYILDACCFYYYYHLYFGDFFFIFSFFSYDYYSFFRENRNFFIGMLLLYFCAFFCSFCCCCNSQSCWYSFIDVFFFLIRGFKLLFVSSSVCFNDLFAVCCF